jgi:hypothetical protein
MTDTERFDAIESREVLFHPTFDKQWEAAHVSRDRFEERNWHSAKTLREAIDLAMGDRDG